MGGATNTCTDGHFYRKRPRPARRNLELKPFIFVTKPLSGVTKPLSRVFGGSVEFRKMERSTVSSSKGPSETSLLGSFARSGRLRQPIRAEIEHVEARAEIR